MRKEIKQIRFSKLYSESNIFDPIIFKPGVNLILGEKYSESTIQGRKTNGVGKSMCIEFLKFALLSNYDKSRVKKIPEETLALDELICLDFSIGEDNYTIMRSRKNYKTPTVIHNQSHLQLSGIEDIKKYFSDILYLTEKGVEVPSFRSLLSLLIREEKSEFSDILNCFANRQALDLIPHIYLLFINVETFKHAVSTYKEIEQITQVIKKYKAELTSNNKKLSDVKSELNALDSELKKIGNAIDSFKSDDAFESFEKDLIEMENMIDVLRQQRKVLSYEYNKIKSLPSPEEIDYEEVELLYNQFKKDLGSAVVKSLYEVDSFKKKIHDFQRVLINQKSVDLQDQIKDLNKSISYLDNEYNKKIAVLDQKGVLKNLKTSLKIYESKKEEASHIKYLFNEFTKCDKQKKELQSNRLNEIIILDKLIEEQDKVKIALENQILEIHDYIMDNKASSLSISTNNRKKYPIEIDLRIFDDGSHSVNRTKVFIYDISLMFSEFTKLRHPLVLVHDNIFDVDQDTLVQSLNYLAKKESSDDSFQYILTLNRDKIENEERAKKINLDINNHIIAQFSKQNKFLKANYQEI